jgi:uncharacterized membrane protein YhaH (DUF805 family)
MNFVESVQRVLAQPVRFAGRAARAEFWWFALFEFVVVALAAIIDAALHTPVLVVIVGLVLLLPTFSVSARRLQDTGRSGWWVLIEFMPFIGLIWLLVLCAQPGEHGDNQFGPSPQRQVTAVGDEQ